MNNGIVGLLLEIFLPESYRYELVKSCCGVEGCRNVENTSLLHLLPISPTPAGPSTSHPSLLLQISDPPLLNGYPC